jgi:hypothetical protein
MRRFVRIVVAWTWCGQIKRIVKMKCDFEGCGRCDGPLYKFGGTYRCERHIRLQMLWSGLPLAQAEDDFVEWEQKIREGGMEKKVLEFVQVDELYWKEVV